MDLRNAKGALDKVIEKSRAHCYKPIQIAEILYKSRTEGNIDIENLESYRNSSKRWRDSITLRLVGNVSTSSQKYQDDLFNPHAMPVEKLVLLHKMNKSEPGIVENYIYHRLKERWGVLISVYSYIEQASPGSFSLDKLLSFFMSQRVLRTSIGKAYEIVVHALFSSIVEALKAEITLELKNPDPAILNDFKEFTSVVLGIDSERTSLTMPARLYRMGVTDAADTGVDIATNFGPIVQVKHISLDIDSIGEIVESAPAEEIVIVCEDADRKVIEMVMKQSGFAEKLRGIITSSDLKKWYKLVLEKHESRVGKRLLFYLSTEFSQEFPEVTEIDNFLEERGYKRSQLKGEWSVSERAQIRLNDG